MQYREYASAIALVRSKGARVVEDVPLINVTEIFQDGIEGVEDTDAFMGGCESRYTDPICLLFTDLRG